MEQFFIISSVILWVISIFNLTLTFGLIRKVSKVTGIPDFEDVPTLDIGTQAPDFSAETLDGTSSNLATFAGQPTAFIFVSPTCTPCIEKIPTIHKIEPRAKRHGVNMVLVSLADKSETKAFMEKHSIKLPTLAAPMGSNPFAEDYKVAGTPFYYFIDEMGKVKSAGFLYSKWEKLVQEWNTIP